MISSDGGAKRQRTDGEEGRRSATLVRQEDKRERRRKWKKVINEIIPQSTSITLHSAGARHARRQPGRPEKAAGEITGRMRVFSLWLSSYYQGQR